MKKYRNDDWIGNGEYIAIYSCWNRGAEPLHMHDFIELIYISEGTGKHSIDGETYSVKKGDLLFVNVNETHSFAPDGIIRFFNILIKPKFFANRSFHVEDINKLFSLLVHHYSNGLDKKKPIVSFFGAELLEAESVIHSMLKEYDGKKGEYDNIICFYFQILIARAIRNVTLREDADVIKKFSTIMRDVEAYIEKEYSAPIQTGDIAKNLFYSPAYFSRCVKKYSGKTYTELVQLKRIEKAGELLKNTKDSVETIAANVGFNDKKNFYKSFKRIYGCSPASYRGKRDSDNG